MEEEMKKIQEELSTFDEILSYKDKLLSAKIYIPFLNKTIKVYYMILKKGEMPKEDLPKDFFDSDTEKRTSYVFNFTERRVWLMINKANKSKLIDKKNTLSKKQWDNLGESFPEVRDQIIAEITGTTKRVFQNFMSGQPLQE
jgi:hypothetical protein